jgi:hypothetical protein
LLPPDRTTKVIVAVAISALVLGGTALVFGLAAYINEASTTPLNDETVKVKDVGEGKPTQETAISKPSLLGKQLLTGNLSVYLLPLPSGYLDSGAIVNNISTRVLPNITANYYYPTLGASRQGQYADETVLITEENITDDMKAHVGDTLTMTAIKKPAETVAFHIHPAVKKPDGSSVTVNEIPEGWSFGNGVICCEFSLNDGTDIRALIVVVDQAYDSLMAEKFPSIKAATNNTSLI